MSEGLPPQPPPPPAGEPMPPAPAEQPRESLQAKVRRWLAPLMPPTDGRAESAEDQIVRWVYILAAVGLGMFVVCGGLYFFVSLFQK
jgi:hypothetical protein